MSGIEDMKCEDLKRKAEKGDAEAQYELGLRYYHGEHSQGKGPTVDVTEALRWFLRSAKQQNPAAAFMLSQFFAGNVYDPSHHVDDGHMVEAHKWVEVAHFYNKLHQSGWRKILDYLLTLSARMSDEQKAEGSRRAGEFLDKYGRDKK